MVAILLMCQYEDITARTIKVELGNKQGQPHSWGMWGNVYGGRDLIRFMGCYTLAGQEIG